MRYGLVRVPERLLTHANHTSVSAGNTSVSAGNTSVSVTCHTFTDLQARRAHTNLGSEASGESVSKEREAEEGEAQEGEVCHNQEDAGVDCPDTRITTLALIAGQSICRACSRAGW